MLSKLSQEPQAAPGEQPHENHSTPSRPVRTQDEPCNSGREPTTGDQKSANLPRKGSQGGPERGRQDH